jgi:hypothetical protein
VTDPKSKKERKRKKGVRRVQIPGQKPVTKNYAKNIGSKP